MLRERWCQDTECVRLLVALATLAVVALLLLASLIAPGDDDGLVTGGLAALSGVLAWYFGSQGLAAAQRQVGGAIAAKERIEEYAARAVSTTETLAREAARYRRIMDAAAEDPQLLRRLQAVVEPIEEA